MKINSTHLRLVGSCPDQVGIIARVASLIADHGGNITESNQYEDVRSKTFFYAIWYRIVRYKNVCQRIRDNFSIACG